MTCIPAARLGGNHGYRLDGDSVHLDAEVSFATDRLVDGRVWSLQLWASRTGFAGALPCGVKVAEFPLLALPGDSRIDADLAALPPAGDEAFAMALMLVATDAGGAVEVHDLAVYPAAQRFPLPRLSGAASCRIADGLAEISLGRIVNPRPAGNLSGTLALEVWALDAPYDGGAWCGHPVASVVLGQLAGETAWEDCHYTVPAAPVSGSVLTVMLREWTGAGYLTRDFRNFDAPPADVSQPEAPVVAALPEEVLAEAEQEMAVEVVEEAAEVTEPVASAAPAEGQEKTDAAKGQKKTGKKKAAAVAAAGAPVSVNRADLVALQAVKGLSRTVASAILAGRPYASLDDLLRVKGVGRKLLEKLDGHISL